MKQNYEIELSKCVNSFQLYMDTYQLSIAFLVLKILSSFPCSVFSGAGRALTFTLFMICFLDCKIFRQNDMYFLLYYIFNFIFNFIFSCHLQGFFKEHIQTCRSKQDIKRKFRFILIE